MTSPLSPRFIRWFFSGVQPILCAVDCGRRKDGTFDDDCGLADKKMRLFKERTAVRVDHYRSAGTAVLTVSISSRTTADEAYRHISQCLPPVTHQSPLSLNHHSEESVSRITPASFLALSV